MVYTEEEMVVAKRRHRILRNQVDWYTTVAEQLKTQMDKCNSDYEYTSLLEESSANNIKLQHAQLEKELWFKLLRHMITTNPKTKENK